MESDEEDDGDLRGTADAFAGELMDFGAEYVVEPPEVFRVAYAPARLCRTARCQPLLLAPGNGRRSERPAPLASPPTPNAPTSPYGVRAVVAGALRTPGTAAARNGDGGSLAGALLRSWQWARGSHACTAAMYDSARHAAPVCRQSSLLLLCCCSRRASRWT